MHTITFTYDVSLTLTLTPGRGGRTDQPSCPHHMESGS